MTTQESRNTRSPSPSLRQGSTLSLPFEVLGHIADHLDPADSVSLSRVSRGCHIVAERGVWRTLDVTINPSYGLYPLINPHLFMVNSRAYGAWNQAETVAASKRHRDRLRHVIKVLLLQLDARWVGLVKRLVIGAGPPTHGPIQLLDILSDGLEELVLCSANGRTAIFDNPSHVYEYEMLDTRLAASGITFSRLRHLELLDGSIQHLETVLELLRMAPTVTSLFVRAERSLAGPPDDELSMGSHPLGRDTALRQLRLICNDCEADWPLSEHAMIELLRISPHLEQLSLEFCGTGEEFFELVIPIIGQMVNLRDLDIGISIEEMTCLLDLYDVDHARSLFLSVRRLVLHDDLHMASAALMALFKDFPSLPKLEKLIIDGMSFMIGNDPLPTDNSELDVRGMTPTFANGLRNSPHLQTIELIHGLWDDRTSADIFTPLADRLKHPLESDFTTWIMSLRHGEGKEILLTASLTRAVELVDEPFLERRQRLHTPDNEVEYWGIEQEIRRKTFVFTRQARWQFRSDYKWMVVPLSVWEEIKAKGNVQVDWGQRGVEMGAEAAAALTDWSNAQGPAPSVQ